MIHQIIELINNNENIEKQFIEIIINKYNTSYNRIPSAITYKAIRKILTTIKDITIKETETLDTEALIENIMNYLSELTDIFYYDLKEWIYNDNNSFDYIKEAINEFGRDNDSCIIKNAQLIMYKELLEIIIDTFNDAKELFQENH